MSGETIDSAIDRQRVVAIIPARGGSKGVPKKNIRLLDGHPLIAYTIAAARMVPGIGRVIVSTDSEEIAGIGLAYGAEVPFRRPPELAHDRAPDRGFVVHALAWFRQHEGLVPDYLVHLRPTTPLRDPHLIQEAITRFKAHPEATALRSAHLAPESPMKWFTVDASGYFRTLRGSVPGVEDANRPRQEFLDVYIPNGYVDVLRTSFIESGEEIHGPRVLPFVTPPCIEIDTPQDFDYAAFCLRQTTHVLSEAVQHCKGELCPDANSA